MRGLLKYWGVYEIKFKIGDKVKIPLQAVGMEEGIIINIVTNIDNIRVFYVAVSGHKIWFRADDLELIKDVEKVIFT